MTFTGADAAPSPNEIEVSETAQTMQVPWFSRGPIASASRTSRSRSLGQGRQWSVSLSR
jgi:hypothetical protein